jgi:hypothetical protein
MRSFFVRERHLLMQVIPHLWHRPQGIRLDQWRLPSKEKTRQQAVVEYVLRRQLQWKTKK